MKEWNPRDSRVGLVERGWGLAQEAPPLPHAEAERVWGVAAATAEGLVSSFKVLVTEQCNLRCAHCGVDAIATGTPGPSGPEIWQALQQARELGARYLVFTGGEPFMRGDMVGLIESACGMGYDGVFVETNALRLTERKLRRLAAYRDRLELWVSLDGVRDEQHDEFRGVRGACARAKTALETAAGLGFRLGVITVLNSLNKSGIGAIIQYTVEKIHGHHRLIPTVLRSGRGRRCAYRLHPAEVLGFLDSFFYPLYRRHLRGKGPVPFHAHVPLALAPPDLDLPSAICGWGRGLVGMTAQGDIGLCHAAGQVSAFLAGNIRVQDLRSLVAGSATFQTLRSLDHAELKGVCGNCLAVRVCRGGCRVAAAEVYSDILAPDPECQEYYDLGLFPRYALTDPNRVTPFPPRA